MQDEKLETDTNETDCYVGIDMLFKLTSSKAYSSAPYLELESEVAGNSDVPALLLIPGIEGGPSVFQDLAKHLNACTIGLNLNLDSNEETVVEMARSMLPVSREIVGVTKKICFFLGCTGVFP